MENKIQNQFRSKIESLEIESQGSQDDKSQQSTPNHEEEETYDVEKTQSLGNSKIYFRQDSESLDLSEEINKEIKLYQFKTEQDYLKINDHYPVFDWGVYLRVTLYHLCFYFLSPLSMIIFCSNPGKIFLTNLGLWWGKNKFSFIYQFLIFLFIMSVFVILYFENQESELVSFCGLGKAELLLLVLFRIHTISVKYALMSSYKLKFLKYIIVDTSLHYKKDFFLGSWKEQNSEVITNEIYSCIRRKEVDISLFYISFITKPDQQTHERLLQIQQEQKEFLRSKNDDLGKRKLQEQSASMRDNIYFGYSVIQYLIETYNQKRFRIDNWKICVGLASIRAIFQMFKFTMIAYKGFSWGTGPVFYQILAQWYLSIVLWQFLLGGLQDLRRKQYLMIQMSFLIKARKSEKYLDVKKQLPTIVFYSRHSLKGWQYLRNIIMDYGKNYMKRIEMNLAFSFIYSIIPIVFTIYYINTDKQHFLIYNYIDLLFTTIIIWIIASLSLFYGAYINKFFKEHQCILEEDRQIISDLYNLKEHFIKNNQNLSNEAYLYKYIINDIQKKDQNVSVEKLQCISKMIEHVKHDLKSGLYTDPFKIFSISLTFDKLKFAITILISLTTLTINVYLKFKE